MAIMTNLPSASYAKNVGFAPSHIVDVSVPAASWIGSTAPFTQVINVPGTTLINYVSVTPSESITSTEYKTLSDAQIIGCNQEMNKVTLKAFGRKPTINLPIRFILSEEIVASERLRNSWYLPGGKTATIGYPASISPTANNYAFELYIWWADAKLASLGAGNGNVPPMEDMLAMGKENDPTTLCSGYISSNLHNVYKVLTITNANSSGSYTTFSATAKSGYNMFIVAEAIYGRLPTITIN